MTRKRCPYCLGIGDNKVYTMEGNLVYSGCERCDGSGTEQPSDILDALNKLAQSSKEATEKMNQLSDMIDALRDSMARWQGDE